MNEPARMLARYLRSMRTARFTLFTLLLFIGVKGLAQEERPVAPVEAIPVDATDAPQEPLTVVEQMPEFPGGQQAMMTYLVKNIHYPQECIEAEVEGKVFIAFVVDQEGRITEVKVLRGVPACPALQVEAMRVVRSMPKWIPGQQNGKPVPVRMTIPVVFKLT